MIAATTPVNVDFDIGAVIAALAALIGTVWAIWQSRKAQARANAAYEASPIALVESLRNEMASIIEQYNASSSRWENERKGMEAALRKERDRAESAEKRNISLLASVAGLRIDLATARSEISELRSRVDQLIANPTR